MNAANEAMRNKEMGSYKVSRVLNVPQTAPERYVKDRQKNKWSNNSKTGYEVSSSLWGRKWCGWALSFAEMKVFWLDSGRRHEFRLPTSCKEQS